MALTYRRRFEGVSELGCNEGDDSVDLIESCEDSSWSALRETPPPHPGDDYACEGSPYAIASPAVVSGDCAEPGHSRCTPWTLPWYEDQVLNPTQHHTPARQVEFHYQGVGYSSLSEAACGALLELLVPGFRVTEGTTYQVPIGHGRSVDFMVNGVLFEYHPPRLLAERRSFGDFRSRKDYDRFHRSFGRVRHDKRRREVLLTATIAELGQVYYERRRQQLDAHPLFRSTELVVATGIPELYERIVLRFAEATNPLSLEQFTNLFFAFVKTIARQNSRRASAGRRRNRRHTFGVGNSPHQARHHRNTATRRKRSR